MEARFARIYSLRSQLNASVTPRDFLMRDSNFTKAEMKALRRLSGEAYERELLEALRSLREAFVHWEAGSISASDLTDRIHEFHNGVARDLWRKYNAGIKPLLVAYALQGGLLDEQEVPASIRGKLPRDLP